MDYARLRTSWADTAEAKRPHGNLDVEKAMKAALGAKDFQKALQHAETILASEYVNIDAHFVAFLANSELGNRQKAAFHLAVYRGLVDSIRSSGDGKSLEKAWVVTALREEYSMLRALGCEPGGQSVLKRDGHAYDEMKAKCGDGGRTYYFNVDFFSNH